MLFAEACIGVCVFLYAKSEMSWILCVWVTDTYSCVYACILKGYTFTRLVLALQPVTRKTFVFVQTQCFYTISCQRDYQKPTASHQGAVRKDLVHELWRN